MAKKLVAKDLNDLISETSSQRILLEEYRLLQERYSAARSEGVTRLNFFITSASVALGGVLVFISGNTLLPVAYIKLIVLVTLILLSIIGLEIHNTLVFRDITTDRYERGLARIRHYFIKLDPQIKEYFVGKVTDIPTNFLIMKNSRMRRSAQVIIGFLLGLSFTIVTSFFLLFPQWIIATGAISVGLIYLILEISARRRLGSALEAARKEIRFVEL
jgi:hypothetical protein